MKRLKRKDNEAYAVARNMRVSPSKANLVLEMIRGKKASDAINVLKFSNRAIAKDIGKVLNSAVANAENNHQLDIDILKDAAIGPHIQGMKVISSLSSELLTNNNNLDINYYALALDHANFLE